MVKMHTHIRIQFASTLNWIQNATAQTVELKKKQYIPYDNFRANAQAQAQTRKI